MDADSEFRDVNQEIEYRENVSVEAVGRIVSRRRALADAYPFCVDRQGDVVSLSFNPSDLGQTAYILSLVLSNLRSLSPLLDGSDLHPSEEEERELRKYFQYFATAALAAEVGGPAWSFGFPRPDRTGFIEKLSQVWSVVKDGSVGADRTAPTDPKDDQIDVFAWRLPGDGLPGCLLAAAQVATGRNWKDKSIKAHIDDAFPKRWFSRVPVTRMVAYHVIPLARPDDAFRDDVLVLGNILHRLRLPRRVSEAAGLARTGVRIEAFDELEAAVDWVASYIRQARIG